MPTSINSTGLSTQYQKLIQRTLQIEAQPREDLKNRRKREKNLKSVVGDLDSKLSSLQSHLSTLTDSQSNPFDALTASAEEGTEAFTVSADSSASTGTHTLSVSRLASNDGRVSQKYTSSGSGLRNFFDTNGQQTFSIEVATPTDDNPDARTSIDVTVDPSGSTNEEILDDIRTAIDDAMETAVDDDTIDADERPSVSVINPTSDTARLSLRSAKTGFEGRLSFTDSADGVLSELQVNADQLADNTQGGEITEVGTSETSSKLTSKFTLDGLDLIRNSNEVTNALDGVTINLEEANGTESSFEVTSDIEGAKSAVKDFIERFNSVIKFLQNKTKVDAESGTRGTLANDSTFRRLQFKLRNDATQAVDGMADGLNTLADIGVETNRDGSLKLSDEDALATAVEEEPSKVKNLFAGSDGVATRLKERVNRFVDTGGILDNREDSIEDTVDRLDDRIERFNERLDRREQRLREKYARVESTIRSLAGQQQIVNARLP